MNGDITTNGIESAFSMLKRSISGSWHKVSAKHLPAYLEEMTFRFNRRSRSDLFVDTGRREWKEFQRKYDRGSARIFPR